MARYSPAQLKIIRAILTIAVWISLIPFVHATALAVAFYGAVLALAMGSFTLLRPVIARQHGDAADPTGHHRQVQLTNLVSTALYAASVPLAFVSVWPALAIFIAIPIPYFLPDRMLERPSSSVATPSPD